MQGFKKGKKLKKMGMKAQDTSELFFEDLRVPKSALLGAENKGFYMVMQAIRSAAHPAAIVVSSARSWSYCARQHGCTAVQELPQERLLIADIAVASAEASYEWTRKYAARAARRATAACSASGELRSGPLGDVACWLGSSDS